MMTPPLEEITKSIVEHLPPRRVVSFGSRARGETRPDSDVDLVVEEMESPLKRGPKAIEVLKLFGIRPWGMEFPGFSGE